MRTPLLDTRTREVSPLELFFDLVFVFGVSQLSHHLADQTSWRGAAETLVVLCAVFGIWSFASFGATLARQGAAAGTFVAVLVVSLFIDAAIPLAFTDRELLFLVPFLVCRVGQVVSANVIAAADAVRAHHRAVLVWVVAETVLWIVGAVFPPDARLGWWAGAAAVSVIGSWSAHPVPGRLFSSRGMPFVPDRMVERSRLLLLIALGETVLSIGMTLSGTAFTAGSVVAALLALTTAALLWYLYFGESDPVVDAATRSTRDAFALARSAINTQLVVLAGLIAIAVADEAAVGHPLAVAGLPVALALHLGIALYLSAQTWYLHALIGRWSPARAIGIAVTLAATPLTAIAPALVGAAAIAVILAVVVVAARPRGRPTR